MATLKKNYLIKKRNILNEIRANNMNLTELRFFSIYLSKIHKDNPQETRIVRFPLEDFRAIMELSSRLNIKHIQSVTNSLLCKVVNVPNERGGYTGFQLFKKCVVDIDEYGQWYMEINAHDDALPLMFDFKNQYFSYPLYNVLRLKSINQHRMYELLKQYQTVGVRIFSVEDLKEYLGIGKDEYPRFGDFKSHVLNICQKALYEHTDIKFTYAPEGKRGAGGKILKLKFIIEKNKNYIDQLTLDMFIDNETKLLEEKEKISVKDEHMTFLAQACDDEFSINEILVLYNTMLECLPYNDVSDEIKRYDYLKHKYDEMNMRNEKTKIKHRFAYLKSIIGSEYA